MMKQTKIFSLVFMLFLSAQLFAQSNNIQTVMNNYAAFGKGDIPAILATLAPNCTWFHSGNPAIAPFAGTFVGPEEIGSHFFGTIPTVLEILSFEPSIVGEQGATVVTSVKITGRAIKTGKTYSSVNEMRWTFDAKGKVVKYENVFDPTEMEAALTK